MYYVQLQQWIKKKKITVGKKINLKLSMISIHYYHFKLKSRFYFLADGWTNEHERKNIKT